MLQRVRSGHGPPVHRREGVHALPFALPYWSADRVQVGYIINAGYEHINGGALVKPTPAVHLSKSNGFLGPGVWGAKALGREWGDDVLFIS